MTEQASPFGESLELDWNGNPIRALMINNMPWMALPDILDACGYNDRAADNVHRSSFPAFGKLTVTEELAPEVPGEPTDTVLLSPTGVFYWSMGTSDPCRITAFVSWARREAKRLCQEPTAGDPAFFLKLVEDADGWTHVPPGPPPRYSGWKAEWKDLKDGDLAAWWSARDRNNAWNLTARDARMAAEGPDAKRTLGLEPVVRSA